MNDNKTNPRKPVKMYHKICTLESIAEEKELVCFTRVDSKKGTANKQPDNNFKPFLSSWTNKSVKTQKTTKSTDTASKSNLRQDYEALKSDYKKLIELSNLQGLKNQDLAFKVEELEEECQYLRFQAEENFQKLKLELKNAEQMKTDYDFLLEAQNQTFKRREKELLEQIEKCTIDTDMQTSTENDSVRSIVNTFEYEEITEKLASFEEQNKFLQSSKDALEIENRKLKDELAEMKECHTCAKLPEHQNKVILYKSNIEFNDSKNFEPERKTKFPSPMIQCESMHDNNEQNTISSNNELENAVRNLQNIVKIKLENNTDNCYSDLKMNDETIPYKEDIYPKISLCKQDIQEEFRDNSDNIIELLHTCLAQVSTLYGVKRSNTSCKYKQRMDNENNPTKQFDNNEMNLSDSEKLNNSNALVKISEVQKTNPSIQELNLHHENDERIYKALKEIHKRTLWNKANEIQELLTRNEDLLKDNEIYKNKNYSQKVECAKLAKSLKEKEEVLLRMSNTQTKFQSEQKKSSERVTYLQSLIDNYKTELNKLCKLLTNVTMKKLKTDTENTEEDFNTNLLTIKEKFLELNYQNEKLKEVISKMNNHIKVTKEIFMDFKQVFFNETLQQMKTLDINILDAKSEFQRLMKSVERDIKEKNRLMNEQQKQIENTAEINGNLIETKKMKAIMEIRSDNNFEKSEKIIISNIDEFENHHILNNNTIVEKLSNEIEKEIHAINIEEQKEKKSFYPQNNQETNMQDVESAMFNNNDLIQVDKIIRIQNWKLNAKEESVKFEMQTPSQARNFEIATVDEYKKEDKWKILRTRAHDSRRNIDLNTL